MAANIEKEKIDKIIESYNKERENLISKSLSFPFIGKRLKEIDELILGIIK